MKTAFLGIGGMGHGMATNLHKAGLLSTIYNRTARKAEDFARDHDVMVAYQPEEMLAQADVVVMCVSADQDVLDMVKRLQPALEDHHVIIDCSTVASDTARQAEELVSAQGAAFVDAPVSGGPEGAEMGTLSIMVGADTTTFERIQPVLSAMGSGITHMGQVGAGQATKAVNQIMVAGINQAVCEALRFGSAMDLPMDKVVDVVGAGAAGNWLVNKRGKNMMRDVFEPGFKLKHHHKDLGICRHMADLVQMELPLTTKTQDEYAGLMEKGHGEEDITALYRQRTDLFHQ